MIINNVGVKIRDNKMNRNRNNGISNNYKNNYRIEIWMNKWYLIIIIIEIDR
jgi:hypothetical protein